jgi:hypothetical protein
MKNETQWNLFEHTRAAILGRKSAFEKSGKLMAGKLGNSESTGAQ